MNEVLLRKCTKCGLERPFSDFHRKCGGQHGLQPICKPCRKTENALYHAEHRDAQLAHMRRYYQENKDQWVRRREGKPERHREANRRWQQRHPEKYAAQRQAKQAIKTGLLVNPGRCEDCGTETSLEAHHEDYSKPLEVVWLCVPCHGLRR